MPARGPGCSRPDQTPGTGVLFNANRSGKLPYRELEAVLPVIAALNAKARDAALRFAVHACTDITGFGIMGQAWKWPGVAACV